MKKLILLIVVLAVIAGGWFLYFNNGEDVTAVSVTETKYKDLKNSLEFSGQVAPKNIYSVMSETGGCIDTIHVKEGSDVGIGDELFDLDTTQTQSLLEEAQLNYEMLEQSQAQTVMAQGSGLEQQKAKIALALSQTTGYDFESLNSAFSNQLADNAAAMASSLNSMALGDTDSLYGADSPKAAGDRVELAELDVQRLQSLIDKMSYKSLIKGTVITVNIHEGEVLSPGIPAMVIADTDNTIIGGYVYEKDIDSLTKGMKIKISADEGYCMGKITYIGKAAVSLADQSNYGAMAKIEITPDESLKKIPGSEVDLEVVLSSKENVLALPLESITGDGCVYVVGKNDTLEKRSVKTGFRDMFYAEILSGVSAGELVVLSPRNLEEGQSVTYDRG